MSLNLTTPNASISVNVRSFLHHDVDAILEVQKLSSLAPAWRPRDYERLAGDPRGMVLVAELEGSMPPRLTGFAAAYRIDDEAELWNLAVAPRYRRRGIARSLLREVGRRLAGAGVRRLLLEVRNSNTPALALYRAFGFAPLLIRKGYYQDPEEDALVLVCKLAPPEI